MSAELDTLDEAIAALTECLRRASVEDAPICDTIKHAIVYYQTQKLNLMRSIYKEWTRADT
jgi:hypothetical protein